MAVFTALTLYHWCTNEELSWRGPHHALLFSFSTKQNHQHQTVNSLNSICSLPTGFIKLPIPTYLSESSKLSIRFICCNIWNSTLRIYPWKIPTFKDPFWINKTNVKTLKHILQKHFLECYWTQISYNPGGRTPYESLDAMCKQKYAGKGS